MRLSKFIFQPIFILVSFYACKTEEPKPTIYDSYLPLAVGNYWIYQHFKINADDSEIPLNSFDSIFIKNDTIIDGQKYFAFYHKLSQNKINPGGTFTGIPTHLRDSAGFLVEPAKRNFMKFLAPVNFPDTLSNDTSYRDREKMQPIVVEISKMEQGVSSIQVPAGNFDVITRSGYCDWYIYSSSYDPNSFEKIIQNNQTAYFSKNIGLIKRIYYYYPYNFTTEPGTRSEIRLVRYNVKVD